MPTVTATASPSPTATSTPVAGTPTALPSPTATNAPVRRSEASPTRTPTIVPTGGFDLRDVYNLLPLGDGTIVEVDAGDSGQQPTPQPQTSLPGAAQSPAGSTARQAIVTGTPAATATLAPTLTPAPVVTPLTPAVRSTSAQPPLVLTPSGEAGGGISSAATKKGSDMLSLFGLIALATGGSWGFFYFLKPKTKY